MCSSDLVQKKAVVKMDVEVVSVVKHVQVAELVPHAVYVVVVANVAIVKQDAVPA